MRTMLQKPSRYDWLAVNTIVAGIHAEVRREIARKHDRESIAVCRHNIGVLFWLYLKIAIGFWVAGMLYAALL